MTYEQQGLEPAYCSWLSDEENLAYALNPPQIPEGYKPWDGWDPNCHEGKVYGPAATPENIARLERIAANQTVSPTTQQILPLIGADYCYPSLDLFREVLWDATASWHLTDEEVQDLGIWTGHKFLKFSLGKLADCWGVTKDSARASVRKADRLMKNEKKQEEGHDWLAMSTALCHLAGVAAANH